MVAVGLLAWFVSAIVAPLVRAGGNIEMAMETYSTWQTFNAGMLAFAASVLAFAATQQRSAGERRARGVAAAAFLTTHLSTLTGYFEEVFGYLKAVREFDPDSGPFYPTGCPGALPTLSSDHHEVFGANIEYGPTDVARRLALVLSELQILGSRLRKLDDEIRAQSIRKSALNTLGLDYTIQAAVLSALVNRLFPAGRPGDPTNDGPINSDELVKLILFADHHLVEDEGLRIRLVRAANRANRRLPFAQPGGADDNGI